ncbi:MAG TPA: NAD(P)-binding protein, partial [Amycolatopsis sp.]|nr:NAD(P)-binding protein [Amycolatopsis sp.]
MVDTPRPHHVPACPPFLHPVSTTPAPRVDHSSMPGRPPRLGCRRGCPFGLVGNHWSGPCWRWEAGMRVVIIGAGIGGLTTALRLHHEGIDCVVYEQS